METIVINCHLISHKCVQTIEVQPKLKLKFMKSNKVFSVEIILRSLMVNSLSCKTRTKNKRNVCISKLYLQEFQYGYNIVETTNKRDG